jgi:FtsZ-interacting cell division protein ZipA
MGHIAACASRWRSEVREPSTYGAGQNQDRTAPAGCKRPETRIHDSRLPRRAVRRLRRGRRPRDCVRYIYTGRRHTHTRACARTHTHDTNDGSPAAQHTADVCNSALHRTVSSAPSCERMQRSPPQSRPVSPHGKNVARRRRLASDSPNAGTSDNRACRQKSQGWHGCTASALCTPPTRAKPSTVARCQ